MGGRTESPGLIGPYGLISRSVSGLFSQERLIKLQLLAIEKNCMHSQMSGPVEGIT